MADPVDRAHRLEQAQVVEPDAVLDHREHQRRRPDLEERRVLGQVRVADDHVQAAVLVGVGVRLVAGVDDPALERGLEPDLHLDVVRALGELVAGLVARGPEPDAPGAGDDLAGHEERRQPGDDRRERRLAGAQVVLVRAVGGALAVDVVLVELDAPGARDGGGALGGVLHDPLARLVPDDGPARGGHLGGGELRVRVVDVEARAVGEDDVRGAEVVEVTGVRRRAGARAQVEPPRVAQRGLHLVVPPGAAGARHLRGRRVGQDDLGGGDDGVRRRVARDGDPVLDLGAHDAPRGHGPDPSCPPVPPPSSGRTCPGPDGGCPPPHQGEDDEPGQRGHHHRQAHRDGRACPPPMPTRGAANPPSRNCEVPSSAEALPAREGCPASVEGRGRGQHEPDAADGDEQPREQGPGPGGRQRTDQDRRRAGERRDEPDRHRPLRGQPAPPRRAGPRPAWTRRSPPS